MWVNVSIFIYLRVLYTVSALDSSTVASEALAVSSHSHCAAHQSTHSVISSSIHLRDQCISLHSAPSALTLTTHISTPPGLFPVDTNKNRARIAGNDGTTAALGAKRRRRKSDVHSSRQSWNRSIERRQAARIATAASDSRTIATMTKACAGLQRSCDIAKRCAQRKLWKLG